MDVPQELAEWHERYFGARQLQHRGRAIGAPYREHECDRAGSTM